MKKILFLSLLLTKTLFCADEKTTTTPTTITSDRVEMNSNETQNIFKFAGNVKVVGNNLIATSEEMDVFSSKAKNDSKNTSGKGDVGEIEKIIARKNVKIVQPNRITKAGHAELFLKEGRIVLTEDPEIEDPEQGKIAGKRITLFQGQQKAIIEGDEVKNQRPTIVLPAIQNLGIDN